MKVIKLEEYVNLQHRGKICDAAIALDTSPVTIYKRLKSGLVVNGVLYAPLKGKSDPRYIK